MPKVRTDGCGERTVESISLSTVQKPGTTRTAGPKTNAEPICECVPYEGQKRSEDPVTASTLDVPSMACRCPAVSDHLKSSSHDDRRCVGLLARRVWLRARTQLAIAC